VQPPRKGAAHLAAFESDLKSRTDTFTKSRSSTLGLLNHLEATKNNPLALQGANDAQKVLDAKNKCAKPGDKRLTKYEPAIRALVRVWGTNNDYKPEVGGTATPATPAAPVVAVSSGSRDGDLKIAEAVCKTLFDVRIADVDFSESVKRAAKAKMIRGKSLYQTVKDDWEKSPYFKEHEMMLTTEKANAVIHRQAGLSKAQLKKIADFVTRHKYAVCESITATVISRCKDAGFGGRMEWIGIPYTKTTGHSIVVARRQGTLNDPTTWGNYFVIDMWYYNLGMRTEYLIAEANARARYAASDITKYLKGFGGLKSMADIT
jgi:hypothetical protein